MPLTVSSDRISCVFYCPRSKSIEWPFINKTNVTNDTNFVLDYPLVAKINAIFMSRPFDPIYTLNSTDIEINTR